jgi:hypothetical protein
MAALDLKDLKANMVHKVQKVRKVHKVNLVIKVNLGEKGMKVQQEKLVPLAPTENMAHKVLTEIVVNQETKVQLASKVHLVSEVLKATRALP